MNQSVMVSENRIASIVRSYFIERPPNVREENHQHFVLLSIALLFGLVSHGSWIPLFWFLGVKPLAFFNVLSVSLFLLAIILNRKGYHFTSLTVGVIEVCSHQTLCVVIIGWSAGFQYYILMLPVGLFLMPHGRNLIKIVFTLICFFNFSVLDIFFRVTDPIFILSPLMLNIFNYSNILLVFALFGFSG